MAQQSGEPRVGIVMGSANDWSIMEHAAKTLEDLGIAYETRVLSAHRTPDQLTEYGRGAKGRGLKVLIAGAGMAAALPGALAALTPLPVFGVPIAGEPFNGMDSVLAMVQMPAGVPVGTLAVGRAGAINAAILSASVLALSDAKISKNLDHYRAEQTKKVLATKLPAD